MDIRKMPLYLILDYDLAVHVLNKCTPKDGEEDSFWVNGEAPTPMQAEDKDGYMTALAWLMETGQWRKAGIDPNFIKYYEEARSTPLMT